MKLILFTVLLVFPLTMVGCGLGQSFKDQPSSSSSKENKDNADTKENEKELNEELKTDIKGLEKHLNLPYKPKRVLYSIKKLEPENNNRDTVPGPGETRIMAFIELDNENVSKLKEELLKNEAKNSTVKVGNKFIEQWYSEEIRKEIKEKNKVMIEDWYPENVKKKLKEYEKNGYIFTGYFYPADPFAKGQFQKGEVYFAPKNTVLIYFHTGL